MNKHSLIISKVISDGCGLGQLDNGKIAMIRQVLPGEKVTITETEEKKKYILGRLLSIEQQSDSRVAAPCQYYGKCGGCDLQHASYPEQLRLKTEIVTDLLSSQSTYFAGESGQSPVNSALPSPEKFHYRQRIRLWVDSDGRCGFRKYRSHDIVPIEQCIIARAEINVALAGLLVQQPFNRLLAHTTELELLWNPVSDKITALFHLQRKPRPADFSFAEELCAAIPVVERVFFSGEKFPLTAASPAACTNSMGVQYPPTERENPSLRLGWEVGGFCQVNLEQNKNLIELVLEYASVRKTDTVLDLFCGSGNFSIPLAYQAKSLLGIEGQGAAIRSAKANSALAGLNNTIFKKSPIHNACKDLAAEGASFECLVIDPPRQGIPGLARNLYSLCRSRLVYISCDPATLCRDLSDLQQAGFSINIIQPVDMFPQTHHIETIVLLEKN